jgi:predicted amidohydrolase YtcJ
MNAKVATLDTNLPEVEAFAVHGGKFIAVGSNSEISAMITPLTKVINARGKTVIPGLNDGHIHMVRAGMYWPYEVRMDDAKSITEILDRIRLRAQQTPPDRWILTLGGWHPSQIKEGRMPTLAELDAAAPKHPVYIQALRDQGQMNSLAILKSKISSTSPLLPGVSIGKDASGNFNGLIKGFNGQALALKEFPPLVLRKKLWACKR